ncbi:MAG: DUF1931 domain-containing protein [Candidatus Pacearchaeota archaeon]
MAEIVIKSKLKKFVKLRVASDLAQALDKKVEEILKNAEKRAIANKRTTIMPQDL